MYRNVLSLVFFIMILAHNSAHTSMKRSLEGGKEKLPKRVKLFMDEDTKDADGLFIRHEGFYYCQQDDSCSYVTGKRGKMREHYDLHNKSDAFVCDKCDFICANNRSFINHKTSWHPSSRDEKNKKVQPVVEKQKLEPTLKKDICGYCGIQGNDLDRHMKVYHTPTFGRRSHNICFPINKKSLLSHSSSPK